MRKRIWMAIAAVAILAVGGMVYAHSIRSHNDSQPVNTSASTDDEPTCPLSWLMNHCGFCR
jgi:hypothetical protein